MSFEFFESGDIALINPKLLLLLFMVNLPLRITELGNDPLVALLYLLVSAGAFV